MHVCIWSMNTLNRAGLELPCTRTLTLLKTPCSVKGTLLGPRAAKNFDHRHLINLFKNVLGMQNLPSSILFLRREATMTRPHRRWLNLLPLAFAFSMFSRSYNSGHFISTGQVYTDQAISVFAGIKTGIMLNLMPFVPPNSSRFMNMSTDARTTRVQKMDRPRYVQRCIAST
jgi:hypothetical protein